jgi:acetyltransferase-like isoleucine patch superfamily enzyme
VSVLAATLGRAATRWKLRACAEVGEGVRVLGRVWIHGGGEIRVGDRVLLDGSVAPIELHVGVGAEIVLGADVWVEGGASLEAQRSIRVGARAHLGRFCKILDNHFHRVSARDQRPVSEQVIIEDDVDLGARSILLPGAQVGRAAVVGAGTVLARRVPAGAEAAGVPALVRRP